LAVLSINKGCWKYECVCTEIKAWTVKIMGVLEEIRKKGDVERGRIGISCGGCRLINP
jgi:hypothetical protein